MNRDREREYEYIRTSTSYVQYAYLMHARQYDLASHLPPLTQRYVRVSKIVLVKVHRHVDGSSSSSFPHP